MSTYGDKKDEVMWEISVYLDIKNMKINRLYNFEFLCS